MSLLQDRIDELYQTGELDKAGIGKQLDNQVNRDIRGDLTMWIEPNEAMPITELAFERLRSLTVALNRELWLGLKDLEAHFAYYPAGTFYKRHADRFRNNPHRVISVVLYLNLNWQPDHGGKLRVYKEGGQIDIEPIGGRLVCFRSELEHEVLPTHQPRYSLTGWMLDQFHDLTFL